jgi:hypothetical protein
MKGRRIPPAGEIRRSQIVTTFGPGAMVDLPKHSVLIGGLESWWGDKEPIFEERLVAWLSERLEIPGLKLFAPPVDDGAPGHGSSGIKVFRFPNWFLGQVEQTVQFDGREYRTRPMVRWDGLTKSRYLGEDRKLYPVVPVRFVAACERGHIGDIDWYAFARRDFDTVRTGELWLDEGGAGNDFSEIFVRCVATGARRPLSDAAIPSAHVFGRCQGTMPWLGPRLRAPCDKHSRLLTRSASNAYFAQTVSAISIPDAGQALREAVDPVWEDHLQYCESEAELQRERRRERVGNALEGWSDEQVWKEVTRRKQGATPPRKGIKLVELETLLTQKATVGEDKPGGDFFARRHPLGALPLAAQGKLDRLVLVHRLREVTAQIGFSRFEPSVPDIDGELDLEIELAPLADEARWLPAYENRGEGVFLSFRTGAIEEWLARDAVQARAARLLRGFEAWRRSRSNDRAVFPGLPYIMLQSLAHLLITALSLDCGYSASAIRERIYANEGGYGILLYTGSPGSEGTLGGLVDVGRRIGAHLARAFELGRLCSNDPVCAQHDPADAHEARFLHGAACHGCLLIAETSCERRNELLDRALVVPTVATGDAAFFDGDR